MTRVLTVDDSRAIRSIVSKQVRELGFEVDEADNGEDGLAKLADIAYDLVVLDVSMPVMDGPEMLKRMRADGNMTPVVMLTSEARRQTVAEVMKAGIDDYVLKPFQAEELTSKIRKALKLGPSAPAPVPAAVAPVALAEAPREPTRQFIDVLVIDDMENVHKRLRGLLPNHISVLGLTSAQSALASCRERVARVILVDAEIPDVNSVALLNQLRLLQPHAAFLSLNLRTLNDAEKEAKSQGFDGVMYKPFDKNSMEDFLLKYFDNQDIVIHDDNVVTLGAHTGTEDRLDRYFQRLGQLVPPVLEKVAAACFDAVVIDTTKMPTRADLVPKALISFAEQSQKLGMDTKVVGTPELQNVLRGFTETAALPFFTSVGAARGS